MLPWDLEDWLTEEGDRVVKRRAGGQTLSARDQLIYEIWLLDTESRNGGLSQYFANRGMSQWKSCVAAASSGSTPSFAGFATEVQSLIGGSGDPYEKLVSMGDAAEETWDRYKESIVRELKASDQGAT